MLGVVVVNYRSERMTIEYVRSELDKITIAHCIVIVNNSAEPKTTCALANGLDADIVYDVYKEIDKTKRIFVIDEPDNLGFAKGNNLGVHFLRNHFESNFILFSNNDIRFLNNDVVERLVQKLQVLPQVGIIGPQVIGLEGENQSPEPYYPFYLRFFTRYWLTPFLSESLKKKWLKFNYSEDAKEGWHYKVMGSFFLVKTDDFIKCGMMDPQTFLYGEEVILTERMRSIGKSVYYYPEVSVLHEHGATIATYASSKRIRSMQIQSEKYYYKKYKKISHFSLWLGTLSANLYNVLKR